MRFDFNDASKTVLVITDLEADDYFAIMQLMTTTKCNVIFIVNSWTNPDEKARILIAILSKMTLTVIWSVFVGLPTCLTYDTDALKKSLGIDTGAVITMKYSDKLFEHADLIISLSPPMELAAAVVKNSSMFGNKKLAIYGGFNLRFALSNGLIRAEHMHKMMTCFDQCLCYEKMFVGPSDDAIVDTLLLEKIFVLYPVLRSIALWWNKEIMKEFERESDRVTQTFTERIIMNIMRQPLQIVDADCALMSYLLNGNKYMTQIPIKITFSLAGLVIYDNIESSNITIVNNYPDKDTHSTLQRYRFYEEEHKKAGEFRDMTRVGVFYQ